MDTGHVFDERLAQRLPLPLAQIYLHAFNGKRALERCLAAAQLWEASIRLLAATAVVSYAEFSEHDPAIVEQLTALSRPSYGHWWQCARVLSALLAEKSDRGFGEVQTFLSGPKRDDMPRNAWLDAVLGEVLDSRTESQTNRATSSRSTVRPAELLDRLVQLRNQEFGHGAPGRRPDVFYVRLGDALLAAAAEFLSRFDPLAGRKLIYVGEIVQSASGSWLVDQLSLTGMAPLRRPAQEFSQQDARLLPRCQYVYLESASDSDSQAAPAVALTPLIIYDADHNEVLFLNGRKGKSGKRCEYLSFTSGHLVSAAGGEHERRSLLLQILGDMGEAEPNDPSSAAGGAPAPVNREQGRSHWLGDFELLSKLGLGGMGVVYRAWQPSLGREVALKCLKHASDAKAAARFAREIRALGQVRHPNLVGVYLSDVQEDRWFYAMELIEGATLASISGQLQTAAVDAKGVNIDAWKLAAQAAFAETRKEEGPFDADDLIRSIGLASPIPVVKPLVDGDYQAQMAELIRQVALAAHALHERGIVHRDIKPSNIMLTAATSRPILMDLGLAQLADTAKDGATETRQFVGTLRYASPEQVLSAGQVDRRADVYALGATLWELLALRPLFDVTDETPTPDLMLRVQACDPERLRKYNAHISADLEAIVFKCLDKDRNRRYATAAELADDLAHWQRGEPVSAQRQTIPYRLRKRVRKHRLRLSVAALAILVFAVLWLGLADSGFPVPGQAKIQNWLDRVELSVFRPALSVDQIKTAAAAQRHDLESYVFHTLLSPTGWAAPSLAIREHTDAWTQTQMIAALLTIPASEQQQFDEDVNVIHQLFEPNGYCDPFIVGYGWPNFNDGEPSAEASGWALSAISMALRKAANSSETVHGELSKKLDEVEVALDDGRSIDSKTGKFDGGWDLFAHQVHPDQANIYVSALVCQGLLAMRRAGAPWHGSTETRDTLLRQSLDFIAGRFNGRGWISPGKQAEEFNDAMTFQIFSLLLDAERDGVFTMPQAMLQQIPLSIRECENRPLDYQIDVAFFTQPFQNPQGKTIARPMRAMRMLWHPWAIKCAAQWLARCQRTGAPHEELVETRRVLTHLVVALGDPALKEAKSGYTYVISETLIGLSAVDRL